MNRISIYLRSISFTIFILFFSFLVAGIFVMGNIMEKKEEELRDRSMLIARTVAELPEVKTHILDQSQALQKINPVVEKIRIINKADYIVVLNMDRVRLSHPVEEKLGTRSFTADEGAAFAEHTYLSKAKGEAGTVIRAFVPVMDSNHKQIGVVISGYALPTVFDILGSLKSEIFFATLLSLFFGGWGTWILTKNIKRQMLGMEPHEIAKLYGERNETFNAMHEGIIAIDTNMVVTIFNDKARKILGVEGRAIGRHIQDVLPDTRLPEILDLDKPIYNKELNVNRHNILSNRIPIKVDGETVGAVAIFQDRTEVKKLAEELTGVKAFVQALRVQNHEHKNKLHTIAGLLQLGKTKQALDYLFQIQDEHEELTKFLNERIMDDHLRGLLLSKITHGKELGIHVEIDRHSHFKAFPINLDHHDFVIILGNLIENAFDSVEASHQDEKQVYISIDQSETALSILVEDNGVGMDEQTKQRIFENGYSTKGKKGRGIGLYLIKEMVNKGNGQIEVESTPNKGASFTLTFSV